MLGLEVTSSEDGARWLTFLRGLAAPGCRGSREELKRTADDRHPIQAGVHRARNGHANASKHREDDREASRSGR